TCRPTVIPVVAPGDNSSAPRARAIFLNIMARFLVVSLHLTDNSEVGTFGKIVSFRHRERGPHHGTAPVVLPTPPGRSRVDLPPQACLVACPPPPHAPTAPQVGQAPTPALQRA